MAGESAREFARRQREKAERHARVAARYEAGADGEAATALALDALRAEDWFALHDLAWPGRPRANIDHVVVGPGGVFVIDTKNWSGPIAVREGVLWHKGRRRQQVTDGPKAAATAVSQLLGGIPVTAALCFTGEEAVSGWLDGVAVCSPSNLQDFLRSRPLTLHAQGVARVHNQMQAVLPPATAARPTQQLQKSVQDRRVLRIRERRTPPVRSRRRKEAPVGRLLAVLALLLGVLMFGQSMLDAATPLVEKGVRAVLAPTHELGEAVHVRATASRPQLEVTVVRVGRTRSATPGMRVQPRHRLVAVEVDLRNAGDVVWRNDDATSVMVSAGGRTYSAVSRFTKIRVGPLLPRRGGVAPGKALHGHVVFEIPSGVALGEVRVSLGPGLPKTLTWDVRSPQS